MERIVDFLAEEEKQEQAEARAKRLMDHLVVTQTPIIIRYN